MLYSHNNKYPNQLPERIRLSNGSTRTDSSTFTEAELLDAGYVSVDAPPTYENRTHRLDWTGSEWSVVGLTTSEIAYATEQRWALIRSDRDQMIKNIEWKISRNLSETRLGFTTTTDNLSDLDTYIQSLRDITNQSDPYNITWPSIPE